jgi:hypothetical protein
MALNFGLLGDAGAPAMGYLQGQQDVARNQLAQQQVETGRMTQDKMRMEMDAMKRRQAGLDQFMQKAKELGVDGDPEQLARAFYDQAIATSDPQQIQAATIAVQAARERKAYMGGQPGAGGAVSTPVPMTNNLGTALPPAGAPPMPFSAGAAPAAAPSQGNALAGNRLSQIENRLVELRQFPTAGAQERADLIKERDRLMTPLNVAAGGSVYNPATGGFDQAPEKTAALPSMVAEYKFAKTLDGGNFKGSYQDFVTARAAAGRAPAAPRPEPAPSITNIVDPTNPNQMIAIDTRRYQGGGVGSLGVIGASGKEPGAAVRTNKAEAGKTQLADDLENLRASFETLDSLRAIPSTERGALSNVGSALASSRVGQLTGQAFATEAQVERDVINSARNRLVNSIKNATGMSAQQLNSNVELQTMLKSISDPGQSYQSAIRIIDDIENAYVKGNGMPPKPGKPAAPKPSGGGAPPPPPGFKPD